MATSFEGGESHETHGAHESAYLIEALFLLTILATAIAVFMSLFSLAVRRGNESVALDDATHLATNVAERFSADPTGVPEELHEEGYMVSCEVVPEQTAAGTLYRATISVWYDDANDGQLDSGAEPIYALEASRYVSGVS